ncbi:MAG TPA: magnesium chelatase domain-containing protein, partial [Planctomycetaceae bacterium]|nr:magnesium chelatase domain-containing protein [Planctomycetaceae bacterium]
MLAKLFSYSLLGIEAKPVEVEVDISPCALPKVTLVGMAEMAVKESTHRVERALVNCGYTRPVDRVVINLSPAELPKDGASFDLPIALGIITACGHLPHDRLTRYAAVGELALDGTVRPLRGALSMALAAREQGKTGLLVPVDNVPEASVVDGIEI